MAQTLAEMKEMEAGALEDGIEDRHPAAYYILAAKLFNNGKRDDAVFWLYAGQLRYRTHLMCHPGLPREGDPRLFSTLNETVGRPVNRYAFGDVDALGRTIGKVLTWDDTHQNGFLAASENDCGEALKTQRTGLSELRTTIVQQADDIRRKREANGLPNR